MPIKSWIQNISSPTHDEAVYSKVDLEEHLSESAETLLNSSPRPPHKRPSYVLTAANLALFITSVLLVAHAYTRPVTDAQCVRQLYTWCKSSQSMKISAYLTVTSAGLRRNRVP